MSSCSEESQLLQRFFYGEKGALGKRGRELNEVRLKRRVLLRGMYFFYGEGVSIGFCVVETIEFFGAKVERLGSKVEPRFRKVEHF